MAYLGNTPGVSSQRLVSEFTATSGQTIFTPSGGYSLGYVDVLVNGVELKAGDDFTAADGITVVLTSPAAAGDEVKIKAWLPRGLSDGYTKSEADARYLNATDNLSDLTNTSTARTNLGLGALATISPTGTPSSSTYLRGDNTWSVVPATSPAGATNEIQYKGSGNTFAASSAFTFNPATSLLYVNDVKIGKAGNLSTVVGHNALINFSYSGDFNTAVGFGAQQTTDSGSYNTSVGYAAMNSNGSGSNNVAYGSMALMGNSTGTGNTAVGHLAGSLNGAGNRNTFIGRSSGQSASGSDNTFIGFDSGSNAVNANSCVILGSYNGTLLDNKSNRVIISDGSGNAKIVADGTGAIGFGNASYGTSGQVLTSQGSGAAPVWQTIASGPSGVSGQVFTASGTFTVPSGVTAVRATVVGAGGAGGGQSQSGGAGGGIAIKYITGLTPGQTISVTVGAANGNTSSFGAFCSATGGGSNTTGLGGTGSGGDLNLTGGRGGPGADNRGGGGGAAGGGTGGPGGYGGRGGNGGGGRFGTGGNGNDFGGGNAYAPTGYGNGGGGNGGNGTGGIVIVEW